MTSPLGPTGRLAGRYDLHEVIGRGRSLVHRARDRRLCRDVAVKRVDLRPGVGGAPDATRARALREARASARVTSPAVVQVYDVVEERSAVWLVMELVRAPSLARVVRTRGPLDEASAARIGLAVLDALEAAHAEGVVHRDVKPANVLVCGPDLRDVPVKLADFGVAALAGESALTSPGMVVGSPSYMAPEQATGRAVGPAADMWALGALLYFAVEGEAPFRGGSPLATATAVVHGRPRPQQRPGRLSRLISLLLDKRPENRPDAARVRAILDPVAVTGEPGSERTVEAVPPAPSPPGRRRAAHRRLLAGAAVLLVATGATVAQVIGAGDDRPGDPSPPARAAAVDTSPDTSVAAAAATRPRPAGPAVTPEPPVEPAAEATPATVTAPALTPTTTVPTTTTAEPTTTAPAPSTTAPSTTGPSTTGPSTTGPSTTGPPTTTGTTAEPTTTTPATRPDVTTTAPDGSTTAPPAREPEPDATDPGADAGSTTGPPGAAAAGG